MCITQCINHPRLSLWLNTHNPSLRNLNQDDCQTMTWVIPGIISFSSQEQVLKHARSVKITCTYFGDKSQKFAPAEKKSWL